MPAKLGSRGCGPHTFEEELMKPRFLSYLSTSSVALMLLAACGGGAAAPSSAAPASSPAAASAKPAASAAASAGAAVVQPGGTVTIGVELPMSGGEAANGVPTSNGVKLAVDQANAKSGNKYKYQVQILDDAVNGKHDPAQGAKNIQQFIGDRSVMGVVGPFN